MSKKQAGVCVSSFESPESKLVGEQLLADGWSVSLDDGAGILEYERGDIETADQAQRRLHELGVGECAFAKPYEWVAVGMAD